MYINTSAVPIREGAGRVGSGVEALCFDAFRSLLSVFVGEEPSVLGGAIRTALSC